MAKKTSKPSFEIASSEKALAFVRKLQKEFPKTPRSKAEQARLRAYLARFDAEKLKSIGRRMLMDILQRPARTIPPYVTPKPKKKKSR